MKYEKVAVLGYRLEIIDPDREHASDTLNRIFYTNGIQLANSSPILEKSEFYIITNKDSQIFIELNYDWKVLDVALHRANVLKYEMDFETRKLLLEKVIQELNATEYFALSDVQY